MAGEEDRNKRKEQIKEEYKLELKRRKEILEQAKRLRSTRNINDAIQDITGALHDDTDEWIRKLDESSAITEAKLDMAFDSAGTSTEQMENMKKEAENERFSAEQLVDEMKKEMGLLTEGLDDDLAQELDAEMKQEEEARKGGKTFGDI